MAYWLNKIYFNYSSCWFNKTNNLLRYSKFKKIFLQFMVEAKVILIFNCYESGVLWMQKACIKSGSIPMIMKYINKWGLEISKEVL